MYLKSPEFQSRLPMNNLSAATDEIVYVLNIGIVSNTIRIQS